MKQIRQKNKLDTLFIKSSNLKKIFKKTQFYNAILKIVTSRLPSTSNQDCSISSFNTRNIVIYTNSQWYTKLRFQETQIIQDLKSSFEELRHLEKIHFKIKPSKVGSQKINQLTVTTKSIENINSIASTIKNEKLKSALKQFSRTLKSKKTNQ